MVTAFQRFDQAIRSPSTRPAYHWYLNEFLKYCSKSSEELVKFKVKDIDSMLFDYIVHQKRRVEKDEISPNSFGVIFSPIQLFLEQNDIIMNWKKLKRMFPRKKPPANQLPYTDKDIEKMLEHTNSLRNKAFIHFMASTACRIGALKDMLVSDMKRVGDGAVVTVYRDDIEEYRTCLTPEAYTAMSEYFEYRNMMGYPVIDDSPLFCDKSNSEGIKYSNSKDLIRNILNSAGLKKSKGGNLKNRKSQNHAFRKRFETILVNSDVHQKYVEYMMGHFEKQDRHYFKPTDEELYTNFRKATSLLTIKKSSLMEVELENQRVDKTKLLEEKERSKNLEKRLDDQDAVI